MSPDPPSTVEAVLLEVELRLMDPEERWNPERLAGLLDDGFVEHAASGRFYTRAETLEAKVERETGNGSSPPWARTRPAAYRGRSSIMTTAARCAGGPSPTCPRATDDGSVERRGCVLALGLRGSRR